MYKRYAKELLLARKKRSVSESLSLVMVSVGTLNAVNACGICVYCGRAGKEF